MRAREEIGQALRQYRVRARINQNAMARTLGVSQSQISRWESGRDLPRAHSHEAISALVFGHAQEETDALARYVRGAEAPLALFDSDLSIIAASKLLRIKGGPLATFGWLFDSAINPVLGRVAQRFRVLARHDPILVLAIPFTHKDQPFACHGRLMVQTIAQSPLAIGELHFVRDPHQKVTTLSLNAAARLGALSRPDRARAPGH